MRYQWNTILLCLALAACLTVQGNAGIWQDDFSGDTLSDGWQYIDPDGGNPSELKDGCFVIHLQGAHDLWGGFDRSCKLLRDAPEGDFSIESHFTIVPDPAAGLANTWTGIIVYDNTDNPSSDLLYVTRGGGSTMTFEYVKDGVGTEGTDATTEAMEVWARIEKTGNTYLCRYKLAEADGWTDLGEYVPPSLNPLKVGFVVKSWADRSIVSSFDYFKMEGDNVQSNQGSSSSPRPKSEAVDVPRDTAMTWQPGPFARTHDVYFGTTFDDVNNASRANPTGVLVSQGQTETTFDPAGLLQFGQTYYWRVDEVNGPENPGIFRGGIWRFTAETFGYPVTGVKATASSVSASAMGPMKTIDGSGLSPTDQHGIGATTMWVSKKNQTPAWIQYEFDKVYRFHQMWVWNANQANELDMGIGAKDVTVEYSVDGTTWATLPDVPQFAQGTGEPNYVANTTVDFKEVDAKYVKLTITSNWGGLVKQYSLSEVRFFYTPVQAYGPEPASEATAVAVDGALNWRPGREAATHQVFFGTDREMVVKGTASVKTLTEHTASLASLGAQYGKTYYWKVNEVNEAKNPTVWEGNVWSFSTVEYAVVDDFEAYNDKCSAIFYAWHDGMGYQAYPDCGVAAVGGNGSGAIVGNAHAPYAERVKVHSGRQSMPLFYNTTVSPFYSEAERTFESPQDWTARGLKSLSLWFRGAAGNSGQLYVKINGTKVVYDGPAEDIAAIGWLPWNIDLSAVGVDIAHIRSVVLGVQGTGSGVVYVDDICLYPRTPQYGTPVAPDAASLVACYALNGNAKDSSGHGHDGQVGGNPTYENGVDGQAIRVDGIDDFIDLGKPTDWPAGKSPRSLSAWVLTSSIASGFRAPVAYGTPTTDHSMGFTQNGTTLYGAGYADDLVVESFWEVNVWYHVCLTYDGTTARLYANGIALASGAKNWDLTISVARIGQQVNEANEFWAGMVDEVRLYNRVLTAEQVAWLAGRRASMPKAF